MIDNASMRVLNEKTVIRASRSAVWSALADFGNVDAWAPNMRACEITGDRSSGVGTRRRMRHAWGFIFEEVVTDWSDGEGLSFNVLSAPFPMVQVQESWQLTGDDRVTHVATQVRYRMSLGIIGRVLDRQLVRFIVQNEMRSGLRGLAKYVENGARTRLSPN
jgi:ligand-binding SRPBCC domain-containing protein